MTDQYLILKIPTGEWGRIANGMLKSEYIFWVANNDQIDSIPKWLKAELEENK